MFIRPDKKFLALITSISQQKSARLSTYMEVCKDLPIACQIVINA